VSFTVNGKAYNLKLDTRTSLLDALREQLHVTSTKKGATTAGAVHCDVVRSSYARNCDVRGP